MSPAPELKATLTLPQTAFPMKANLPQNEPLRLARWAKLDLYAELRKAGQGRPAYILHDGPPYANGPLHLGHALNKGLKDFVVKSKTMAGFDSVSYTHLLAHLTLSWRGFRDAAVLR